MFFDPWCVASLRTCDRLGKAPPSLARGGARVRGAPAPFRGPGASIERSDHGVSASTVIRGLSELPFLTGWRTKGLNGRPRVHFGAPPRPQGVQNCAQRGPSPKIFSRSLRSRAPRVETAHAPEPGEGTHAPLGDESECGRPAAWRLHTRHSSLK